MVHLVTLVEAPNLDAASFASGAALRWAAIFDIAEAAIASLLEHLHAASQEEPIQAHGWLNPLLHLPAVASYLDQAAEGV